MKKVKQEVTATVRAKLAKALESKIHVRVVRADRAFDRIWGYVVGVGDEWVLLALLGDGLHFGEYCVVRLNDIKKVQFKPGRSAFFERVLTARGQWPPAAPAVNLDDVGELVRTVAALAPMLTIFIEREEPDVCFIGKPVRVTGKSLHLLEISPAAEWAVATSKWRLKSLTRLEFGAGYDEGLALAGGPADVADLEPGDTTRVRRKLEEARQRQLNIRLGRRFSDARRVDGFVVGVGESWALIALRDDWFRLDGYVAVRLGDIQQVAVVGDPEGQVARTLKARGEWPPAPVEVNLDDVADLIRTAASHQPVINLFDETVDPDWHYVGVPSRVAGRIVHLTEINWRGKWRAKPAKLRLKSLTRIEFGGRHEESLVLVGGPAPLSLTPGTRNRATEQ